MRILITGLERIRRIRLHNVFRLLRLNIVVAAANFAISVMLARGLGAEGRGQVAILVMWVSITAYLALSGSHLFVARKAGSDPGAASEVYVRAMAIVGITFVPSMLAFAAIAFIVTEYSAPGITPFAWVVAAAAVPFGVWNAMQMQIELGRNRLETYIVTQLIFALGQVSLIGLLWIAGRHEPVEYISATLIASALACLVTQWMVRRHLPVAQSDRSLPSPLAIIIAARKDALATWLVLLTATTDRLVVSLAFLPEIFGVYVVALALSHLQNLAIEAMAPLFFTKSARNPGAELQDHSPLAGRLRQTVLINAMAAIALVIIAPVALPLAYGAEYAASLALVYFMVPAFALRAMMRPYEEVLRGADRAMQQSAASMGMLLVFAITVAFAVRFDWVAGIALSLVISSLTGLLLVLRAVSVKTRLTVRELFVPQFQDATGLIAELLFHARGIVHGR